MSRNSYTSAKFGPNSNDRDGFQPLNRGDTTIDIPLQNVSGYNHGPAHDMEASTTLNEKQGFFKRRGVRKAASMRPPSRPGMGFDGEENKITRAGQIYNRVLSSSVVVRYFIYILPLAAVLSIPIIIGSTAAQDAYIGDVQMAWLFVWLLCSWAGLWISKIVAHFLPHIFQAICGVVSSSTRKYYLILKHMEIPISICGWALVTLATFVPLMTRNPAARADQKGTPHWVSVVQQILAAAMVSSLVYAGECLFIQIITISYHRKQFHSKIRDNKRILHLIGILYDASRTMFPSFCMEFAEEDETILDLLDLSFGRQKKKSRNSSHFRSGSSTPMRVLQDLGNIGDKVTAAFGNVAHEVTGKQIMHNPNSSHTIVAKALERNRSSEALARRLWLSFVMEGHEALYQQDVAEVLGAGRQMEAEECFALLDQDGNGDVSLDEMILTITQVGRDRSSIANSMHDVDQAIKVLDSMLCVVISIVVVFIFIAFLNSSFTTMLATAGTVTLSLSFIFATSAQEILGSCVFLFVKHPFDIGDRIDLNTGTDKLVVDHISLLFTVFRRVENHRTVQIPNIVLNTLWIENVSRSNAMKETLSIYVAFDTSLADINLLRLEMKKFVTDKENSRDFHDDINIEVRGINEMNKLELSIDILHKSNWANESLRSARRSKFMCALVIALRKVPIYGPGGGDPGLGTPGNPSYSVAVSDAEAISARTRASDEKESKRLVPTQTNNVSKGPDSPSDVRYMALLNERSPAIDGARDAGSARDDISSTSARVISNVTISDAESTLLRRQTTKGRRKTAQSGQSESSAVGLGAPIKGDVPSIGITAPMTSIQQGRDVDAQTTHSPPSDEDWYGENENREDSEEARISQFPPPPPPAVQTYRTVPSHGQWRS